MTYAASCPPPLFPFFYVLLSFHQSRWHDIYFPFHITSSSSFFVCCIVGIRTKNISVWYRKIQVVVLASHNFLGCFFSRFRVQHQYESSEFHPFCSIDTNFTFRKSHLRMAGLNQMNFNIYALKSYVENCQVIPNAIYFDEQKFPLNTLFLSNKSEILNWLRKPFIDWKLFEFTESQLNKI